MLSEELRQTLVNTYRQILFARMTERERLNPDKDLMDDVDNILERIADTLNKSPLKWTESRLIDAIPTIAGYCAAGLITWDEKEQALNGLLKTAYWNREELREMNRRREYESN